MTAVATLAAEMATDPVYQTDFIKEMLRQTRALDSYGQWEWTTTRITTKTTRPR